MCLSAGFGIFHILELIADTASTEAKEELTPDSSKSTQEKLKETFTDTTDKAARYVHASTYSTIDHELITIL